MTQHKDKATADENHRIDEIFQDSIIRIGEVTGPYTGQAVVALFSRSLAFLTILDAAAAKKLVNSELLVIDGAEYDQATAREIAQMFIAAERRLMDNMLGRREA